jgi:transcriptional regulator with XRE-family HTH domain
MPARNTSSKRRNFGIFLGALRDSYGEDQKTFAKRLNYSTAVIANTETGRTPPSEKLIKRLAEEFSEQGDAINTEALRWAKTATLPSRQIRQRATVHQRLHALLTASEVDEARDYLRHELSASKNAGTDYFIWLCEQLSLVDNLLNQRDASRKTLTRAILPAQFTRRRQALSLLWEQLAISLYQDDRPIDAHLALDKALAQVPTTPSIWYRKAVFHWDEGKLSAALAALTTAQAHKAARLDVLYARGQIYAEMGIVNEAIADLAQVLNDPHLPSPKTIRARSAHAYAVSIQIQDIEPESPSQFYRLVETLGNEAMAEFGDVLVDAPNSPWPHYFRAAAVHSTLSYLITFRSNAYILDMAVPNRIADVIDQLRARIKYDLLQALRCSDGHLSPFRVRQIKKLLGLLTITATLQPRGKVT